MASPGSDLWGKLEPKLVVLADEQGRVLLITRPQPHVFLFLAAFCFSSSLHALFWFRLSGCDDLCNAHTKACS